MVDDEVLLSAYDDQMRGIGNPGRPGLIIERDGPVVRVAGQHRGMIAGPRDLGVSGPELDALSPGSVSTSAPATRPSSGRPAAMTCRPTSPTG
ncbi:MAG TPA: hypothetical protein VGM53_32255 [Streptosporangiaceae bacterium]